MARICLIEDSDEVAIVIRRTLGTHHALSSFKSLEEARRALHKDSFDLILLDIGLPDGDGLHFCAELKNMDSHQHTPLFILTARSSISEKTLGFQLGIDDFISKPFDPMELRLRVDARLRKERQASAETVLGSLRIDHASQRVVISSARGNEGVSLSSKEFGILTYLARNPDQVKSRDQIISAVWGPDVAITDRSIDSHISRLRKKILSSDVVIEAVANSGYRLSVRLRQAA